MLTDIELAGLYHGLESDRVERKRNADDAKKIRQAICAFANDMPDRRLPGVVFIGQEDDGSCSGTTIDDDLLLKLAGWGRDGQILPLPVMKVASKTIDGCKVAVIEVQSSDNPPVRYDGRAWIRVGPRRAVAPAEEERRLVEKRRWGNLSFDAQGVSGATLDDLDLIRFGIEFLPAAVPPDILADNNRTQEQRLKALNLLRPEGMPTAAAILMLGKNPLSWFPGAYVQFLRIEGTELTDPILDQHEISGVLTDQIRRLDDLVEINIRHTAVVGGAKRIDQPDYPAEALRQLIRNALIHRAYEGTNAPVRVTWFSDCIEIQSPGGPFGQVTVKNFGQTGFTDYRNPTVAGFMVRLGFMERFGVGIAIARNGLAKNDNPQPEFHVNENHVLAIVRARS